MSKTLHQFLEVYRPKSADEQKFVDKHVTVKNKDKNGNGDDVFQATNVKTVGRKKENHGYEPGEDEKVYEELKGGQKNLDKNHNGKLDAQDFKLLRKNKMKEEIDAGLETELKAQRQTKKSVADAKKKYGVKSEEAEQIEEAGYSAKAAAAGKDIGKPGKQFAKIAKKAAEKYGSKERGEKVAGAVLAKLRKEDVLRDLANGLSESNVDLMVSVFEQLSEDNQDRFLDACQTPEGLDAMLDFSITNRNK